MNHFFEFILESNGSQFERRVEVGGAQSISHAEEIAFDMAKDYGIVTELKRKGYTTYDRDDELTYYDIVIKEDE